jgi:hypothetical protein
MYASTDYIKQARISRAGCLSSCVETLRDYSYHKVVCSCRRSRVLEEKELEYRCMEFVKGR